jgi:two-component system phosphate regulon response regulator PhoB
MPRLLLIEDDTGSRAALLATLQGGGHQVLTASRGRDGLRMVAERRPDLIVLEWALPDISGATFCRDLKASSDWKCVPIMVVSGQAAEVDRVVAFELGVDDYVARPFSTLELLLRVKALLRRTRNDPNPEEPAAFGRLTIQRHELRVWVDEREVALTRKEFQLLLALYDRRGKARTRELLLRDVWRRSGNETRTVDTHVTNLREKLGSAGGYIQTVRGVGYRFADAPDRSRRRPGRPAPVERGTNGHAAPYRVLIVDPDEGWRNHLQSELAGSKCTVHQAASGASGLREAERLRPQVVVIDASLPDLSATDVCRQIRGHEALARAVVMVTSAGDDDIARVVAFELGADDYLRKPLSVRELALRIEGRVRDRFPQRVSLPVEPEPPPVAPARPRCRVGALELDREAHQAFVDGTPVPVSASELRLLLHLYDRRGAVSTREDIAAAVWNRRLRGTSRAVDTLMKRLRQKLGTTSALIETVRGSGYRMSQTVNGTEAPFPPAPFFERSNAKEVTQ